MKTAARIAALALSALALTVSGALAQQRAFVSAQLGSDANACGPTTPCRTFLKAMSVAASGGEIIVLDSGGYGPFTISKAISINAPPGVYAGITAFSGDGVDVAAGGSDVVALRGLTINGLGGVNGVNFTTGAALHIENCAVSNFTGTAYSFTSVGQVFFKDSSARSSGNGAVLNNGSALASIDACRFERNTGAGLLISAGKASIRGSVASANANGFEAVAGTSPELSIEKCLAANNTGIGVSADGAGTLVRVSNSTVTDNGTGLSQTNTATLVTRSNNTVEGNGAGNTSPGTYAAK
jgi:Right handed beta helix region